MEERIGQALGHYRLLRRVGLGAFAAVYEAEHLYLKRRVAVKVLRTSQPSGQEIEQFRAEAERAARLEHPISCG
jgi:serine/threonine protein kinase